MKQYTPEEMMRFFQSGTVPPTQQPISFDELYFKLDNEFLPKMVDALNRRGYSVHVHLEVVQVGNGSPTANISFWHSYNGQNHWLQEFACAVDHEGMPYYMPVHRQG